jgi:hypothetical protein
MLLITTRVHSGVYTGGFEFERLKFVGVLFRRFCRIVFSKAQKMYMVYVGQ